MSSLSFLYALRAGARGGRLSTIIKQAARALAQ